MCWSETPKGVFDGTKAKEIGEELIKALTPAIHSPFQPGEKIGLEHLINLLMKARDGEITAVKFGKGVVKYDIQVPVLDHIGAKPTKFFRISNIDAELIKSPDTGEFHYNDEVSKTTREYGNPVNAADSLSIDEFIKKWEHQKEMNHIIGESNDYTEEARIRSGHREHIINEVLRDAKRIIVSKVEKD